MLASKLFIQVSYDFTVIFLCRNTLFCVLHNCRMRFKRNDTQEIHFLCLSFVVSQATVKYVTVTLDVGTFIQYVLCYVI